jgi:hypothetical protein
MRSQCSAATKVSVANGYAEPSRPDARLSMHGHARASCWSWPRSRASRIEPSSCPLILLVLRARSGDVDAILLAARRLFLKLMRWCLKKCYTASETSDLIELGERIKVSY